MVTDDTCIIYGKMMKTKRKDDLKWMSQKVFAIFTFQQEETNWDGRRKKVLGKTYKVEFGTNYWEIWEISYGFI